MSASLLQSIPLNSCSRHPCQAGNTPPSSSQFQLSAEHGPGSHQPGHHLVPLVLSYYSKIDAEKKRWRFYLWVSNWSFSFQFLFLLPRFSPLPFKTKHKPASHSIISTYHPPLTELLAMTAFVSLAPSKSAEKLLYAHSFQLTETLSLLKFLQRIFQWSLRNRHYVATELPNFEFLKNISLTYTRPQVLHRKGRIAAHLQIFFLRLVLWF